MNAQRLLQINIAVLVSLGTLLLGMGQESVLLPIITLSAAVLSVIFTDVMKWFWLNRHVANLAAIASIVSLRNFDIHDSETQLIAIADWLVFLQAVLLFREKSVQIYWQLTVLSLLQVVVASALNLGFEFGLFLVVYMFTALSAGSLLFVYQQSLQFHPKNENDLLDANEWLSAQTEKKKSPSIVLSGSFLDDPGQSMLDRGLGRHVLLMGLITVIFTVIFFSTAPRIRSSQWGRVAGNQQSIVGFSETVSLHQMGKILQSDTQVMTVSFYEGYTFAPYEIHGEPYFRGVALDHYESKKGTWGKLRAQEPWKKLKKAGQQSHVMQVIAPNRTNDRTLFSVHPVYNSITEEAEIDESSMQIRRPLHWQRKYRLLTNAFYNGWQIPLMPNLEKMPSEGKLKRLLQMPTGRDELYQLRQRADLLVQRGGLLPDDRHGQAKILMAEFIESGRYQYSLNPDIERSSARDPIEDFVTTHRQGHCEYFASALVLMLRSQGIPARIVLGYKGGEYNSTFRYYEVQELHAHAWVEAYLEPQHIPEDIKLPDQDYSQGAWLRLDPTPSSDEDDFAFNRSLWSLKLKDLMDYAQLMWSEYVVDLESERNWSTGLITAVACFVLVMLYRAGNRFYAWLAAWLGVKGPRSRDTVRRRVEFYLRLEKILRRIGLERYPSQTQQEFATAASGHLTELSALGQVAHLPRRIVQSFYLVRFGGRALDNHEAEKVEHALRELEKAIAAVPPKSLKLNP